MAWWLLVCPASLVAQSAPSSGSPFLASPEKLNYNLLWASGISLGEATLQASRGGGQIFLEATVIADLPQYHVAYTFSSVTTEQLCSLRFRQTLREGRRTTEDVFEFDPQKHEARRTRNGRTTTAAVGECPRDPLALLYFFRQQLALGKVPVGTPEAAGKFHLGEDYTVHYDAVTPEGVPLGGKEPPGDRFLIRAEGTSGGQSLEVWIGTDAVRLPVAVKIPFSMGTFSAELQ